jgi:hypothetical protein
MSSQHGTPRTYRIYLLDELGQISGMRVVESTSDEPAVGEAASIIRQSQVEVWQGDRRVSRFHIEPKDNLVAFPSGDSRDLQTISPLGSTVSKPAPDLYTYDDDNLLVASEATPAKDRLSTLCTLIAILACLAGIVWAATHPI